MEISAGTSGKSAFAWFTWQQAAGVFVGILGAGYLEKFMQAPLAWAIGGLIWGAFFSLILTDMSTRKKMAFIVYHGSLMGYMNWLLNTYF